MLDVLFPDTCGLSNGGHPEQLVVILAGYVHSICGTWLAITMAGKSFSELGEFK